MELLEGLRLGVQAAFVPTVLLYCLFGVSLGTLIGVLPGVGSMAAISLLLPITYYLEPTPAIVMLAGVYYGAQYGNSIASILLNLPGTASSAVTCLDGYPMAKAGRAGVALFMTTIASFVGAMLGLVALTLFAPSIAEMGFRFGPYEYFAMMLLGLVAASTLASASAAKGLAMVTLGLIVGIIGTDVQTGVLRFHFGFPNLMDGVSLPALAMGMFGVTEVIRSINRARQAHEGKRIRMRSMLPTRSDLRQSWGAMLRGSGIGGFFGALPGTGASIASFMAYAVEKRVSRTPERFGKGAIEGITAPESANNAAVQTAFVPTLSLGIPGDAVMALMLGALMIHGIQPGPSLITQQPEMFWGLIVSFLIGNIMLLVLNIPMIGVWVWILSIPYRVLYPAILVFIAVGVYSVSNSTFDVFVVAAVGIFGYVLAVLKFEPAPFLLGFILGPLMEENLRRGLQLARGDAMVFLQRPISGTLLAICALLLVWALVRAFVRPSKGRSPTPAD